MIENLGRLIGDYGYLIIGLFIFAEGLAVPFPTDTTLITAAALAAHGRLSLLGIFLVATVTATLSTTIAFVGGRRGGHWFDRHSKRVNPALLARTRGFMDRHGGTAVLAGRFVPFARMLISPLAGLSSMSLGRFMIFNTTGAAIWAAAFCGIGYFFGHHPPSVGPGMARVALIVIVSLALLVTIVVAGGWLIEESDAAWRAEGTLGHRAIQSAPLRWLAAHSPSSRAFLFRRFTPGDYLGLNLTIGLGLSFVSLVIFSAITKALMSAEAVPQFDLDLASALRATYTPARLALWSTAAGLGRLPTVVMSAFALALWLVWRQRTWLPFLGLAAAFIGSVLLDTVVKHVFVHQHLPGGTTGAAMMGTPSVQSLGTLVGYGMVAYFLILLVRRHNIRVLIAMSTLLLVMLVSFGRLYLSERYFSDVVSGLAAGGVWLSACLTGLEVARRRDERRVVDRAQEDRRIA